MEYGAIGRVLWIVEGEGKGLKGVNLREINMACLTAALGGGVLIMHLGRDWVERLYSIESSQLFHMEGARLDVRYESYKCTKDVIDTA